MKTDNNEILLRTADMYIGVLRRFLTEETSVHPETLISSASRMAGTLMFRSFGFNTEKLEPGQTLLSNESNVKGQHLTSLVDSTLKSLGDNIDIEKAKASLNVKSISKLTLKETQERFEGLFTSIADTVGISLSQASSAACIASAILVHEYRTTIDINRGYITAVYSHIEALNQVPVCHGEKPTLEKCSQTGQPTAPEKKPWFKFW
jgi:hypothetical protein